jgi:hypothetical protein
MGSEPEGGNLKTDTLPPSLPELKIEDTFQIRRDFYRAQRQLYLKNPQHFMLIGTPAMCLVE